MSSIKSLLDSPSLDTSKSRIKNFNHYVCEDVVSFYCHYHEEFDKEIILLNSTDPDYIELVEIRRELGKSLFELYLFRFLKRLIKTEQHLIFIKRVSSSESVHDEIVNKFISPHKNKDKWIKELNPLAGSVLDFYYYLFSILKDRETEDSFSVIFASNFGRIIRDLIVLN